MLQVIEHYPCLVGEGLQAGLPALLLRLAGCNLSCVWCDTAYSREEPGYPLEVDAAVALVAEAGFGRVLLTGGEPLAQRASLEFCKKAVAEGMEVLLETNGSMPLEGLPPEVVKIVDLKPPSSQADPCNTFLDENLRQMGPADQLKVPLAGREDYLWFREFAAARRFPFPPRNVLLSPVFRHLEPGRLAAWIMEDRLPYRLHLQLHKYVWGEQRGV